MNGTVNGFHIFKPTGKAKTYKWFGKTLHVPGHWWTAWIGGANVPSLTAATKRTLVNKINRVEWVP